MQLLERLSVREQRSIFLGMIGLGLIIGYSLGWQPFAQAYSDLSTRVRAQQETLNWMRHAAINVQQLRSQSSPAKPSTNTESILSMIDKSLARSALATVNRRIEPKDAQTAQVSFEQVSFSQLLTWLGQLDQQHQIRVKTLTVIRQAPADLVSARLTLQR